MNRFKNILVVANHEGDNHAIFERAAALTKSNDGRLTIFEAVSEPSRRMQFPGQSMTQADIQEVVLKQRQEQLTELVAPLRRAIENVRVVVRSGISYIEVIRQVLQDKHDLVMVMSEDRSGIWRSALGSTVQHLMRKCPCPIWVLKPSHHEQYKNIVAAVDPDSINVERDALNKTIMELATSMAQFERSELHIVHVWDYWGENALRAYRGISNQVIDRWVAEMNAARWKQLSNLLTQYSRKSIKYKVHFSKGIPGKLIPEIVGQNQIDLIVMGTLCRTGIEGYFIGNTAENILQKVDCSILAVKPEGFESPVRLE